MLTTKQGRLIIGGLLIAIGVLTLLDNAVQDRHIVGWLWVLLFAGGAVAFGRVFTQSRKQWALLGTYIAGAIAAMTALGLLRVREEVFPALVLLAVAAPFLYGWWLDRSQWAFLIPPYVMGAIALMLLFEFGGEGITVPYLTWAIALPFLVAFLVNRENRWALVPAAILFVVGLTAFPGLSEKARVVVVAVAFMGAGGLLLVRSLRRRA